MADAPSYPKDWNYGNAIFSGSMLLGRVALRRDKNIALARNFLIASGKTPGSPQLNSFGPNMSLAKDLLAAGERDTVLEFFGECRLFRKQQFSKLDQWTATVKGGGVLTLRKARPLSLTLRPEVTKQPPAPAGRIGCG